MRNRRRLRLTVIAAALLAAAPAAHALTLDTLANPSGGPGYADPADRVEAISKGKSLSPGGFQFNVGPTDSAPPGRPGSPGGFGPSRTIGPPPDQSRFNDR